MAKCLPLEISLALRPCDQPCDPRGYTESIQQAKVCLENKQNNLSLWKKPPQTWWLKTESTSQLSPFCRLAGLSGVVVLLLEVGGLTHVAVFSWELD